MLSLSNFLLPESSITIHFCHDLKCHAWNSFLLSHVANMVHMSETLTTVNLLSFECHFAWHWWNDKCLVKWNHLESTAMLFPVITLFLIQNCYRRFFTCTTHHKMLKVWYIAFQHIIEMEMWPCLINLPSLAAQDAGLLTSFYLCKYHAMETLSMLLALCEGNPPVTGGFPSQGARNTGFDVSLMWSQTNCWTNSHVTSDLRLYHPHITSLQCALSHYNSTLWWPFYISDCEQSKMTEIWIWYLQMHLLQWKNSCMKI